MPEQPREVTWARLGKSWIAGLIAIPVSVAVGFLAMTAVIALADADKPTAALAYGFFAAMAWCRFSDWLEHRL